MKIIQSLFTKLVGQEPTLRNKYFFSVDALRFLVFCLLASFSIAQEVTIAAAGDISCTTGKAPGDESCRMMATSDLILNANVDAVLALGDLQYPDGTLYDFENSYALTWGRFKDKTYPAIGNHEYGNLGQGYFAYFGERAGAPDKGYYSFDLGTWHLVALNSNCWAVGGCTEDSPQGVWLREDLTAHANRCTLAFWHHPRFNSGKHGDNADTVGLWNILTERKAEVLLHGHSHIYERFAPQLSDGTPSADGLRQFIVGTGGVNLYRIEKETPNSEFTNDRNFGVLFMTLKEGSYDWKFVNIAGETLDAGEGICH
jgi:acid phosphatase type 7